MRYVGMKVCFSHTFTPHTPHSLIHSKHVEYTESDDGEYHAGHENLIGYSEAVVFDAKGAAQKEQVVDDGLVNCSLILHDPHQAADIVLPLHFEEVSEEKQVGHALVN